MSVIYCGKSNKKAYYIKEADLNIYSIQELAYFIFEFPMLITNNFVSKNLIVYISRDLGMVDLADELNVLYNTKDVSIAIMLKTILKYSNYYSKSDIDVFSKKLVDLLELNETDFINLAGDNLFNLKKYEKAIIQYKKIISKDLNAIKKLGFCYAKMQYYDKAIIYLSNLYRYTEDVNDLRELYFCYKLSGNPEGFNKYRRYVDENTVADWDLAIVTRILRARNSEDKKNIDEIFLMGDKYIKENLNIMINIWKEEYRYIS